MPELREIIYRLRLGQSIREINRETGTHRTIVRGMADMGRLRGWLDDSNPMPEEHEIQEAVRGSRERKAKEHPLDSYKEEIARWLKAGYTYTVIHRLILERYQCDESTVRRYVQRTFPKKKKPVIRRDTIPGEIMEVDFGELGKVFDYEEMRVRKAYVFSGRLNHSRHAYREVVFDQKAQTFFQCHIHAFEYFGGVPAKVVPDNLKAAVIKASHNDPLINRSYRMLAEHYGFTISPTLPYTPEHKGGVENDIKFIKKNFWPVCREKERRKGRDVPQFDEVVAGLIEWSDEVSRRTVSGVGIRPIDSFRDEEQERLRPLPKCRWEPAVWKTLKVQEDYTVQSGRAYYSVPYRYIGEHVQACIQASILRIYHDFEEIACHRTAIREWARVRLSEHGPPNEQEYLNATSQGTMRRAAGMGEPVRQVVESIFADRAVDGLRPARSLLRLAEKYGAARLVGACERALAHRTPAYKSVKKILKDELDLPAECREAAREEQESFRFGRDGSYFEPENQTTQGETNG